MKKVTHIIIVGLLALSFTASAALATDMNHESHGTDGGHAMTAQDGWAMMQDGLAAMKKGQALCQDPATMADGLAIMKQQMMPMHNGMMAYGKHMDGSMSGHMDMVNKGMMVMMRGMGAIEKDHAQGMGLINDGIAQMDKGMGAMHGM